MGANHIAAPRRNLPTCRRDRPPTARHGNRWTRRVISVRLDARSDAPSGRKGPRGGTCGRPRAIPSTSRIHHDFARAEAGSSTARDRWCGLLQALLFFGGVPCGRWRQRALVAWGSWPRSSACGRRRAGSTASPSSPTVHLRLPLRARLRARVALRRDARGRRGPRHAPRSAPPSRCGPRSAPPRDLRRRPVWLVPDAVFVHPPSSPDVAFAWGSARQKPLARRLSGHRVDAAAGARTAPLGRAGTSRVSTAASRSPFFTRGRCCSGASGPARSTRTTTPRSAPSCVELGDVPDAAVDALRMLGGPAWATRAQAGRRARAGTVALADVRASRRRSCSGVVPRGVHHLRRGGGYSPSRACSSSARRRSSFTVANLRPRGSRRQSPFAEDVGEQPEGGSSWTSSPARCSRLQSLLSGRRSTHVAGAGRRDLHPCCRAGNPMCARAAEPQFFAAGKGHPAVVRFSNVTWRDQAALDVLAARLRLALPASPRPSTSG